MSIQLGSSDSQLKLLSERLGIRRTQTENFSDDGV